RAKDVRGGEILWESRRVRGSDVRSAWLLPSGSRLHHVLAHRSLLQSLSRRNRAHNKNVQPILATKKHKNTKKIRKQVRRRILPHENSTPLAHSTILCFCAFLWLKILNGV